jgi:hypothetical protein
MSIRAALASAVRWWRHPLQDFLQVKVGAKALEVGEDPRPCKSQKLPTLSVDELQDFGRGVSQPFSQLVEEVDDRPVILGNGGKVNPWMPRQCAASMTWAENP